MNRRQKTEDRGRPGVGTRFIASSELKASIPRVQATFHQLHDIRNFVAFTANSVHLKKPSGGPKGLIGPPCHGAPGRRRKEKVTKKILIIAAHPDDEILGCGGTAARLVKQGNEAYSLILGEGITSRDDSRQREKREKEIAQLKKQVHQANEVIGIDEVFTHDFPDNRFDSIALLDIVKAIETIKNKIKPDIVFTHYEKDLNIDHQITYRAVLTAMRPTAEETVKEIYSFEVLSSTEWNFPLSFSPDVFYDITETIDMKVTAMEKYQSELREYPHPRSLKGIRLNAEQWGMKTGLKYAEAFKLVRLIK